MPQLDTSTYSSQIFWLIIVFSTMFGIFLGVILPKLSSIFQKRVNTEKHADQQIQSLSEVILQLQKTYDDQKETSKKEMQFYIEESLAAIRSINENRLQSLEKEIQQELHSLQSNNKHQYENFDADYKDIIDEAVSQIIKKLGIKNEY